jgi:osomolarity two-component system sensor histidine kinase NIK1
MAGESQLGVISAVVKSLATDPTTTPPALPHACLSVKLPGPETPEKAELERELAALVFRVQQLEARANAPVTHVFPTANNDLCDPFTPSKEENGYFQEPAVRLPTNGSFDKALGKLHGGHGDDAPLILNGQSPKLGSDAAQLLDPKHLLEQDFSDINKEGVEALVRELYKSQMANQAFQKALREIGEILTAVARGDLSKKVQLASVEMDPEITTFKRTINTMMDQLQVFSSEVSRVAREVGTEGILGGQAQIEGVAGTWKELTDNGEHLWLSPHSFHELY